MGAFLRGLPTEEVGLMNRYANVQNLADVFEHIEASMKVGADVNMELNTKRFGDWVIRVEKIS